MKQPKLNCTFPPSLWNSKAPSARLFLFCAIDSKFAFWACRNISIVFWKCPFSQRGKIQQNFARLLFCVPSGTICCSINLALCQPPHHPQIAACWLLSAGLGHITFIVFDKVGLCADLCVRTARCSKYFFLGFGTTQQLLCLIYCVLVTHFYMIFMVTAPYGIRESTRRTGSHKDYTKPPDGLWVHQMSSLHFRSYSDLRLIYYYLLCLLSI